MHWFAFFLLLALAGYLRHFAFFLPSNLGDSTAYQSLAMKMNHGFMRNYNVFNYRIAARTEAGLADYVWEANPRKWQSLRIRKIYHRTLHLQPPLYPILIWLSHGIFQHGEAYTSVTENRGRGVIRNPPWHFARAHFYAIVLPFLASLGTLVLVYLFCLRFYSWREGLIAVALLAVSPVDIAVGPKLYADGLLTFFCFLCIYCYARSLDSYRDSVAWAIGAGLALGAAYLTKVSGLLFAMGPLVATFLHPRFRGKEKILAPQLWWTALIALLVTLPWLGLMYRHYGSISVNTPTDPNNPWYRYVFARPFRAYLADLFWFLPPLAIGAFSGIIAWLKPRRRWLACSLFTVAAFYTGMFGVFLLTGTAGVEDRYLLPVYPPLAILSAWGLGSLAHRMGNRWIRACYLTLIWTAILLVGWRSVQYGLANSFAGLVIFKPLGY